MITKIKNWVSSHSLNIIFYGMGISLLAGLLISEFKPGLGYILVALSLVLFLIGSKN